MEVESSEDDEDESSEDVKPANKKPVVAQKQV